MSKTLALFGSTGSIGKQTLEVLRAFPGDFEVVGMTALKNAELLAEQAEEFLPKENSETHALLAPTPEQIATLVAQADFIINAVPGFDGLAISLATVRASTPARPKILLSANKESLAIAGKFLRTEAQKTGAEIRPLDSEASAIWQLLGEAELNKKRIIARKFQPNPLIFLPSPSPAAAGHSVAKPAMNSSTSPSKKP